MGLSVSWETSVAQGLKASPQMSMRNFLISAAGPWMRYRQAPDLEPGFKRVLPTSLSGLEAGNLIFTYLRRCVPTACLPYHGGGGIIHQGQALSPPPPGTR